MKKIAGNTLILTATNVFNRTIGFAFRIILIRIAGREAIGLWQMIMPLYLLFLVIASAGLSVATSRLVAEHHAKRDSQATHEVFKTAMTIALVFGFAATILLLFLAGFFSQRILGDSHMRIALLILAPSLPLVAAAAVFRGYFQGIQEIKIVSTSLVVEQVTHVATTFLLVTAMLGKGPGLLVTAFAAGSLLSEVAGFGVYLAAFPLFKPHPSRSRTRRTKVTIASILRISVPSTATRLVHSLAQLLQSIIIPLRLRSVGWSVSQAAIAYGELTGMAINLLFLPSLFTVAMATTLLPQITTAVAKNNRQTAQAMFLRAINWIAIISLPIAALLVSLGGPICQVLFKSASAGRMLELLAWGGLLLYTQQVSASALQGLGKPGLPLITSILGSIVSSVLLFTLIPLWQMAGVAFSLIAGWATTGSLSLILVQRHLPFWREFQPRLWRLALAAVMSGLIAHTIYLHCLANSGKMFFSLVAAGFCASISYLMLALPSIKRQFAAK